MELTNYKKVAKLMLSFSPKDAANVLKNLEEDEVLFVGEAILMHAKSVDIKDPQAKDIGVSQGDFTEATTRDGQSFLRMSVDDFSEIEVVRALYRIAFGEKRANILVDKLFRTGLVNQLSFLNNYSAQHIFLTVQNESDLIISLVIGVIKPKLAAEIIRLFEPVKRAQIIKQISIQHSPSNQAVKSIETVLKDKLFNLIQQEQNSENFGGEEKLMKILENMDPKSQDGILNSIDDLQMRERIKYRLFTWNSLEKLNQKELEEILNEYSNKELAGLILLDGQTASESFESKLSKGRMKLIEDELELIRADIQVQSQEMSNAAKIKKQFFMRIKEYLYQEV